MNILKALHQANEAIEHWMRTHPWRTIIYMLLAVAAFIATFHVAPTLCMVIFFTYMVSTLVIMVGSGTYLSKIGYQPPRCDKCGHVLPEKRPSNGAS